MSRYISADYLKGLIKNNRLLQGNCEYKLWEQEVDKRVDAMPSIDIVRCKECKWHHYDTDDECRWRIEEIPKDDDFCSRGERRE